METLNLGGPWAISSTDGQYKLTGNVPGSLFADLENQGTFGPEGMFWRENNRDCLQVADRDFVFSRSFSVETDWVTQGRQVFLEADGLDTLATITLNGKEIARVENMHRRYRWNVGAHLQKGQNTLSILFANSLDYCRQKLQGRPLWHAYDKAPDLAFAGFNGIRKSHCSYGWDWGPIIPDVGIWRDIRLVAYEGVLLTAPHVLQTHRSVQGLPVVDLEILAAFERLDPGAVEFEARLTSPTGAVLQTALDSAGKGRLTVQAPELWWPRGLGSQPLYDLEVTASRGGRILQTTNLTIGLRTLTVRREPDQWGESFEFVANGRSFFACGADYIPEDVALARVTRAKTERLVADAAAANFNCLRVWGGGVYPSDDFYDLCDRYGMVVWQDLMFACALYDMRDDRFKAEIAAEVQDNALRLRHHASLGLICGNNEMEWGFVDWDFPKTPATRTDYLEQYQFLFPQILSEVCPEVFYWPASPSSGGDFDQPNSPDRGDCHFWDVWHQNKDYTEYTKHKFRFMSEFGFESFPHLKTIEGFTLPADRNAHSPVMDDHQRCAGGNAKILNYAAKYFRAPKDFAQTVYVSQVSQSEAQRAGIEHWRRNRGQCMGSVYWQLNDNWPVASWSSIDSEGRWKLLHYTAKRAYAPALLSSVLKEVPATTAQEREGLSLPASNGHFEVKPAWVEIHLSNESPKTLRGELEWKLIDLEGKTLREAKTKVAVEPWSSRLQTEVDLRDLVHGREVPRNCVLCYRATLDGVVLHGFQTFVPFKMLDLRKGCLEVTTTRDSSGRPAVQVRTDKPVLFVWLDHPDFELVLSDNGFFLEPGWQRVITVEEVRSRGLAVAGTTDLDNLSVTTLVDTYY